jgi:small nuclear ribonucleoprotein (snRNP)-like protein
MKTNIIFILFFILSGFVRSQEVETVQIKKKNFRIYQGVLKETKNWFLVLDEDRMYYLVNVDLPANEVRSWFLKFKDSQNVYKAKDPGGLYPVLKFSRENDPGDNFSFYLANGAKGYIVLTNLEDNTVFQFVLIE